jgi:hypothetical protein
MSSEGNPLAVVIATLEDHGAAELPIKNTFIHFPAENDCHKMAGVQRFRTDPSSEARLRRNSGIETLDSSATTSGSSTPQTFDDDASSSADSMLSISSEDEGIPQSGDGSNVFMPTLVGLWMPVFCATANAPSEAGTLPMLPQLPAIGAGHQSSCPCTVLEDGSFFFGFTHRRADGVDWGLDVIRDEERHALLVKCVHPGAAIESWNKQVAGGPKADRAIRAGDLILRINNKHGCQAMINEGCKVLWKIEVLRPRLELTN